MTEAISKNYLSKVKDRSTGEETYFKDEDAREQLNNIANEDLIIKDGKLYIKQADGTEKGAGVEIPTGTAEVPSNIVLFEEIQDTSEEIPIPIKSTDGTTYYFHVDNNGIPFIKNTSGTTVWNGTSGGSDTPITPTTSYNITNTLTNCTSNNSATTVEENTSYNTTITANEGYTLSNITVTMGGTDISSTAVSGNNITISSVTGDIVITASATEIITDDNLIDVSKAGIESGNGKMPDNAQTTETFIVTPYIEVNNTKQYYTNLSSKVDTEGTITNWNQKIYFYNSSKTYIKCTTYQSGDLPSKKHAVSFPTGTAYVRVLFDTRYTTITPYFGLNSDNITV